MEESPTRMIPSGVTFDGMRFNLSSLAYDRSILAETITRKGDPCKFQVQAHLKELVGGKRDGHLELGYVRVSYGVREGNPKRFQKTLQFGAARISESGKDVRTQVQVSIRILNLEGKYSNIFAVGLIGLIHSSI